MPDEALGDWLTADTLRARLRELPSGDLGNDYAAASRDECLAHLAAEGIDAPEEGQVPASYRIAQTLMARTLLAERAANADAEAAGIDSQTPLYSWRKRARDLLGYGSLGIS